MRKQTKTKRKIILSAEDSFHNQSKCSELQLNKEKIKFCLNKNCLQRKPILGKLFTNISFQFIDYSDRLTHFRKI